MAVVDIPAFYNLEVRNTSSVGFPVPTQDAVCVNCYTERLPMEGFATSKRYGFTYNSTYTVSGVPKGFYYIGDTSASYGTPYLWSVADKLYFRDTISSYTFSNSGYMYYACSALSDGVNGTPCVVKKGRDIVRIFVEGVIGTALAIPAFATTTNNAAAGGIVYLDGTWYALTVDNKIYGSGVEDYTTWSSLNMITVNAAAGAGIFIGKYYKYVTAFCRFAIQFFYNAGNATGSPLSPVPNAYLEVGLISETAIEKVGDTYFWVGQTKSGQMRLFTLEGMSYKVVSIPAVDKILTSYRDSGSSDTQAYVVSAINYEDRVFVVVSLARTANSNQYTLAYDTTDKTWAVWTYNSRTATGTVSLALSLDLRTVTVTHSMSITDQSFVTISGATPSVYNGTFPVTVISGTQFSYNLPTPTSTIPTGTITCSTWVELALPIFKGCIYDNVGLGDTAQGCIVQGSTGNAYLLSKNTTSDTIVSGVTSPISVRIRTDNMNFKETKTKTAQFIEVIGDKINSTLHYRVTNNDYSTYNRFVAIPLNSNRSRKFCSGRFTRRAWEFVHVDDTVLRINNFSIDILEGM